MANGCGVDSKTVREWISVLEHMNVVVLVPPYASNLTSRLVKSPKLYFADTGLASRLQGWSDPLPIATSPQQGALFENLVFSELWKTNLYSQLGWRIFHWRSRDQEEIDFLIQLSPMQWVFVEAKVRVQQPPDISNNKDFPSVKKVFGNHPPPIWLCHQEGAHVVDCAVPIAQLGATIMAARA